MRSTTVPDTPAVSQEEREARGDVFTHSTEYCFPSTLVNSKARFCLGFKIRSVLSPVERYTGSEVGASWIIAFPIPLPSLFVALFVSTMVHSSVIANTSH